MMVPRHDCLSFSPSKRLPHPDLQRFCADQDIVRKSEWKTTRVSLMHKNSFKSELENYRPVYFISLDIRIFEVVVGELQMSFLNENYLQILG